MTEPGPPTNPPHPPPAHPQQSNTGEFADFFHTDELPDRIRPPRSHRASLATPVVQRLLPPATAVVVVVVVILLLIWINGKPAGKGPGAGVITGPATSQVVPSVDRPAASVTPRASQPVIAPPPTSTPAGRHHRAAAARAPVAVLNNSTISGLAAQVASELRAKKWNVAVVGNLQRVTPVTTVYFPAGRKSAARHLAHDFGQIKRVLPNSAGGFHTAHLTLVVTRDWS